MDDIDRLRAALIEIAAIESLVDARRIAREALIEPPDFLLRTQRIIQSLHDKEARAAKENTNE